MLPALLALLAGTFGCGSDSLELVVDVRTDLVPGVDFTRVRTEHAAALISGDAPAGTTVVEIEASADAPFEEGVRVAELRGVKPGASFVRVRLLDAAGGLVVERVVALRLRGNFALVVVLSSECVGVSCPGAGDPAEATECVHGECTVPDCSPAHPEVCPMPDCLRDADCPAGAVECLAPVCVEGGCLLATDDSLCGSAEVCNRERGCVSAAVDSGPPPGLDAGPPPVDAGGATERDCSGGADEDGDGLTDCDDPDCVGRGCAGTGTCVLGCCRRDPPETLCSDGVDGDCDGQTDCEDSDCVAHPCDPGDADAVCRDRACCHPRNPPPESACDDGVDGDCDGEADCLDVDCLGDRCAAGRCCGMSMGCTIAACG